MKLTMTPWPLLLQVRVSGARTHHRRDDVDVQRLEPVLARRGEPLVDVARREVDEDVDPAEAVDRLGDERVDLPVVAEVGRDEGHAVAELVGEGSASLLVDVRDCDGGAGLVERAHDGASDERGTPGDDRRPAVKRRHRRDPTTRPPGGGRKLVLQRWASCSKRAPYCSRCRSPRNSSITRCRASCAS